MWDRDSSQNRQEVARHDAVASRMPVVASTLIRQFTVEAPNRMRTTEGWLYLTVTLALYSRFAISWAMGFRLTMDSPEQVLTMALPTRPQGPGSCTIRIAAAIRRYALPVSAARPLAMTSRPSTKQGQQSVTRCPRNRGEAISLSEPRFRALTT